VSARRGELALEEAKAADQDASRHGEPRHHGAGAAGAEEGQYHKKWTRAPAPGAPSRCAMSPEEEARGEAPALERLATLPRRTPGRSSG